MVVHQHRRRRGRAGEAVLAVGVALAVAAMSGCGGPASGDDRPRRTRPRWSAALPTRSPAPQRAGPYGDGDGDRRNPGHHPRRGGVDFKNRMGQLLVMLPADVTGKAEHRPITELLVPGALYMKNRGAGVPDDKWVRVDTTTLADGNLVTGGATDPLAAAELLRGAQQVTYVGETDLAGTKVRHYQGTTDIGRAARSASPGVRGALEAAAKGFSKDTVPFDVYLDMEGRLRKVRHRFSYVNNGVIDVSSTTLLYGFGTPVTVTLPPSGDIYAGKIAG